MRKGIEGLATLSGGGVLRPQVAGGALCAFGGKRAEPEQEFVLLVDR